MQVRVNVLGSVEVTRHGKVIHLSGQGQRVLLAALSLDHGKVVSPGRLIDALWDAAPPASARTRVHAHVSALRLAIGQPARSGAGPLFTIGSGYMLSRDGVELDLAEFGSLAARGLAACEGGQPAAGSELLAAALALWRGAAFADVSSPAIRAAAAPLEERRLLVVESKAEADLALGRCDAVAAELPAWLAAQPLRERLRGLLMVALYRHGCRADALRLYRDGRRIMVAELGLEPGAQLRSLHRRILADAGVVSQSAPPAS
jgi:SARP family transcriptional regulator, regulator of embCAB operon